MPTRSSLRLLAAPHAPLHADGTLNVELVPELAQHLIDSGVVGVFVNGTTGEGMSLTVSERCALVDAWKAASGGRLSVLVHAGAQSLGDAETCAAHAAEAGADGVAAVAPAFHRPEHADELVEWLARVAAAAGDVPFWYYHLPSVTHVGVPCSAVLLRAAERIPTFRGVKFTDGDLLEYARCVRLAGDRHEIAFGVDELLLAGLAIGARSAVGSTYNYAAPLYLEVSAAYERGDIGRARELMGRVDRLVHVLFRDGVVAVGKALMGYHGFDLGPPRLPLRALDDEARARVIAEVQALRVFEGSTPSR